MENCVEDKEREGGIKMVRKSNKNISISKDSEKSYVYIKDGKKEIGILMWHYKKKRWIFEDEQKKKKRKH